MWNPADRKRVMRVELTNDLSVWVKKQFKIIMSFELADHPENTPSEQEATPGDEVQTQIE